MPGIQLVQNKLSKLDLRLEEISSLAYTKEYQQEIIFQNETFTIFKSAYQSYPLEILEDSESLLILESYKLATLMEYIFLFFSPRFSLHFT